MKRSLRFRLLITVSALIISGMAFAQEGYQDPSGDPPSRVMRLQYIDGQVSLQPGGVDDWVPANQNRPLTTADRIWVDVGGRAELTMASAAMRLGSETSVTLTNLDDQTAQIEMDQGTLELSVRFLNPGEIVEVDTPNFAYTVERPGQYRFDVYPDQDQSWVTVRRGDGEASGEGDAVRVRGGQQFRFSQGQSLAYQNYGAPGPDGFEDWCAVRERREISSPSAQYVAAGTIGYEDLDDNGVWEPAPEYGSVWYPRVHEGWAPYREGHWAWVEPWGWTWVDDAPWGFAPFHYGRWAQIGGRWGWIPGPMGVRPVYAPALVAWVGGPSFGVSVGIGGGVGWFPLGWHDPFIPSYHVSPGYARNVNVSNSRVVNVTVINNYYTTNNVNVRNTTINNIHYENARVNGAVTGVSNANFASGKSIRGNAIVVPPNAVGRANVMTAASVAPTREAVLGGRTPAAAPQRMVAPRQVVSKQAPPPRPVSFDQQRPLLEKSGGVPLSPAVRANIRASNPAPAPRGGQPAGAPVGGRPPAAGVGNQSGAKPPVTNQPRGNETFGRPTGAPGANQPATRGNETPARGNQPPAATNQPAARENQPPARGTQPAAGGNEAPARGYQPPARTNQPPASLNTGGEPARNVSRPPVQPAPAQPARNAEPPAAERTAPPSRQAVPPAPKPAPEIRTAPPERATPPAPRVATPPPSRPAPEVRPEPQQHTATPPPAVHGAPPQQQQPKKTPPPEKDKNKEKEKDR
jgi:hypothetical protein